MQSLLVVQKLIRFKLNQSQNFELEIISSVSGAAKAKIAFIYP